MTDPERLLSGQSSLLLQEERELLSSLRDVEPGNEALDNGWNALSTLAAAPAVTTAAAGAFTVAKVITAGLALAGGAALWSATRPAEQESRPRAVPSLAAGAPVALGNSAAVSARPLVTAPGGVLAPSASSARLWPVPMPASSALREEREGIQHARTTLRAGAAKDAIKELNALARRFPKGVLAQERAALTIEALALSGNAREARARLQAFSAAYPNSPHSPRLEALLRP